jgi:high-affinity K+ transport system ATPase subunit B
MMAKIRRRIKNKNISMTVRKSSANYLFRNRVLFVTWISILLLVSYVYLVVSTNAEAAQKEYMLFSACRRYYGLEHHLPKAMDELNDADLASLTRTMNPTFQSGKSKDLYVTVTIPKLYFFRDRISLHIVERGDHTLMTEKLGESH